MKIQRSNKKYTESAYDEEKILKVIADNFNNPEWTKSVRQYFKNPRLEVTRDHTFNVQMFDWFFHHSTNGKHFVMAFEVLGPNMLSMIKRFDYKGIPMPMVREIAKQCLIGLDYMHRICKLIHTDLKPENVTFGLSEKDKFDLLYQNILSTKLIDLYE